MWRQQLVGDAGVGVLLLEQSRHAGALRGLECRPRCVAAHADGNVGLKLAHYPTRYAYALPQLEEHGDVAPQAFAVEATDRQADDFVTGGGYTFHFHAVFGTDKEDVGIGVASFYGVGDRQCRENMSPGASAAD